MAAKAGNWEGLRKQARALENDIDTKLVSFSKLGTNYTRRSSGGETDKQLLLVGRRQRSRTCSRRSRGC